MAKSFKRAIACLLAVLMVAFSMPFTALAALGDYEPDIELNFYPVYLGQDWGDYSSVTGGKNAGVPSYHVAGLDDVAFNYDKTAGTLTMPVSKAQAWLDEYFEGSAEGTVLEDGDWTLGVGDYFAATVVCKNISTLFAIAGAISFSDNIEPAIIYDNVSGTGRNAVHRVTFDANDYQGAQTAKNELLNGYYDDVSGVIYNCDTEMNEIDEHNNMFISVAGDSPYSDVSSYASDGELTNPKTGALGYNFANEAILGTFIFKIINDGPITFSAADTDNSVYELYNGGKYCANFDEGIETPDAMTTAATGDWAGAGKMTYFAEKDETPADTYYTVTYVDAEGETISTEEVKEGGSPAAIPDLPTSDDAHVSYAWDVDPNGAVINAATTYTVVKTTADHVWSDWTVTTEAVAPTCTEAGKTAVETRTCTVGGETETRGGEDVEALGHNYEAVVTEPTCTEAGYTTYTCSRCGDTYTADPVDALGHDWGEWKETSEAVAATCVATGTTAGEKRECSRCDAFETKGGEEIPVDPDNHTNIVDDAAVNPTCTETGLTAGSHCADCGAVIVAQEEIPALGHDFGEWTVTTEPTCTEAGEETRYCSRCDATETQPVEALGHEYTTETTAPTCTERGFTTYTCIRGDDSYVADYVDALGHDFGEWTVTTEPTCTEAGEETRYCSRCDATETRPVEALGHNYEAVVTEPTCTEQGYTTHTCSRCDDSYVDSYVDALGHDYGEWQDVEGGVPATCEEDGMTGGKIRYCSRCDAYETQGGTVIPATGHAWGEWTVTTEAVAATCTVDGATAIETRVCENDASHVETRGGEAIPATGHTPAEAVEENRVEATCEEDGSYDSVVYCSVCGAELSREKVTIPATGHAWGDWTVTTEAVAATCTVDGATAIETRVCDNDASHVETRGGEAIPATGHTPAEAVEENRVEATCEEDGSYDSVVYCSVCGAELSRENVTIPATGHAWGEWTVVEKEIPATEEADGKTAVEQRVCANDASHVETRGGEVIPALDHVHVAADAVEENRVEATCTEDGSYDVVVYCVKNDGYEFSRETITIPATGHAWGNWEVIEEAIPATKTTTGKTAVEQRVCATDASHVETRGGEEIPALGILVTADYDAEIATVTFDKKGTKVEDNVYNYAYGTKYTVKVDNVADGYVFQAWEINGKTVSTSASYTNVAYADVTVTPIFAKAAEEFEVVFYDMYGNYIATKTCTAGNVEAPEAPARPGYTFKEWSPALDTIESATKVYAKYTKSGDTYTVTAEGATITIDGVDYDGTAEAAYDTKVKLYVEGASAWQIGETVVAYGDTYEFYLGADTTVVPVMEAKEEEPTVAILDAELIAGTDYRYNIRATKYVPDGYTLEDCGIVYGKNLTDADLDVDKEGQTGTGTASGAVKVKRYGKIKSNEFSLGYGISKKDGDVTAKAFIVVTKDGKTEVIYSDMFVKGY